MSLQKYPSGEQLQRFVDEHPRREGDTMEAHVRLLLDAIVRANVQTNVALHMGTSTNKITNALQGERTQLGMICRIAEVCNCEITIRPLP